MYEIILQYIEGNWTKPNVVDKEVLDRIIASCEACGVPYQVKKI